MTEAEFRVAAKRHSAVLLSAIGIWLAGIFATMAVAFLVLNFAGPLAFVLIFAATFLPLLWIDKREQKHSTLCPECNQNLPRQFDRVLITRQCPGCSTRVISDGRQRSEAVYERFRRIQQARGLNQLLWIWPVFFAGIATAYWLSPGSFDG